MKLLEKAPERRYQSAVGLLADLERLAEIHAGTREVADFELGRDDLPIELVLPHRLYGRMIDRWRAGRLGLPPAAPSGTDMVHVAGRPMVRAAAPLRA